jgi:hypothetical protein
MQDATLPAEKEKPAAPALVVHDSGPFADLFDSARFAQMQRIATLFAASKLVPAHFQGDMPSCFVALQMALRLGVDPFMLLQNTYTVSGRPGMEAKLVLALINSRGPFEGPVQWRWSGTKGRPDWTCTAFATHEKTGALCEASVSWEMVEAEGWNKKSGSKWNTMPEMMFRYRSVAFLARLYCPEVIIGLSTVDELHDITAEAEVSRAPRISIEATPGEDKVGDLSILIEKAIASGMDEQLSGRLEEFFAATAKANEAAPIELLAHALNNFEAFFASFRAWLNKHPSPTPPAAEEQKPRRRRAVKFITDDSVEPVNTCGISPEQIEEITSARGVFPQLEAAVQAVFERIGYQDLSWLTPGEAGDLLDLIPEVAGEAPEKAPAAPQEPQGGDRRRIHCPEVGNLVYLVACGTCDSRPRCKQWGTLEGPEIQ